MKVITGDAHGAPDTVTVGVGRIPVSLSAVLGTRVGPLCPSVRVQEQIVNEAKHFIGLIIRRHVYLQDHFFSIAVGTLASIAETHSRYKRPRKATQQLHKLFDRQTSLVRKPEVPVDIFALERKLWKHDG